MGQRLADIRHRVVPIPSPAAGAQLDVPTPAEVFWLIRHLTFQLATSAVVANRQVVLTADDGVASFWFSPVNNTQAASLTVRYVFYPGSQKGSLQANIDAGFWPIDGLIMAPASHLRTAIVALDAGDQIQGVALQVVEFETGPIGAAVPMPPFYVQQLDPLYAG
jgi:hypothetical protein